MSWGAKPKEKKSVLTAANQQFLEAILADKSLSRRALDEVQGSIASGTTAWVEGYQSGRVTQRAPASQTQRLVKVPKVGTPVAAPVLLPHTSGRKLEADIKRDTPYEREQYIGHGVGMNRDMEKDRLANVFTYGRQNARALQQLAYKAPGAAGRAAAASSSGRDQYCDDQAETEAAAEALRRQIGDEIDERVGRLEALEAAGGSAQQEAALRAEIQTRLHELRRWG